MGVFFQSRDGEPFFSRTLLSFCLSSLQAPLLGGDDPLRILPPFLENFFPEIVPLTIPSAPSASGVVDCDRFPVKGEFPHPYISFSLSVVVVPFFSLLPLSFPFMAAVPEPFPLPTPCNFSLSHRWTLHRFLRIASVSTFYT